MPPCVLPFATITLYSDIHTDSHSPHETFFESFIRACRKIAKGFPLVLCTVRMPPFSRAPCFLQITDTVTTAYLATLMHPSYDYLHIFHLVLPVISPTNNTPRPLIRTAVYHCVFLTIRYTFLPRAPCCSPHIIHAPPFKEMLMRPALYGDFLLSLPACSIFLTATSIPLVHSFSFP